jgi:hypothetical protein
MTGFIIGGAVCAGVYLAYRKEKRTPGTLRSGAESAVVSAGRLMDRMADRVRDSRIMR